MWEHLAITREIPQAGELRGRLIASSSTGATG
jgi:hypothetical protein